MNASRWALYGSVLFTTTVTGTIASPSRAQEAPPVAKKILKITTLHGVTLTDDYAWLRGKEKPEVVAHLKAENKYTESVMNPLKSLTKKIYGEIVGRIKESDTEVPYLEGDYLYYTRTEKGKQYPIYCRKRNTSGAKEEITLDLNEMAKGKKFVSVRAYAVSDNGELLAYSVDYSGYREYQGVVKNLRTGKTIDNLGKVTSLFWTGDNKMLFYGAEDAAKRPHQIYRHTLGADRKTDAMVYEDKDEQYSVGVERTRDKKYLFLASVSRDASEYWYIPDASPTAAPTLMYTRKKNVLYRPDHRAGLFYIQTNDKGNNFRMVSVPVSDTDLNGSKAVEIVPHRADVVLDDFDLFENWIVRTERENGLTTMQVTDFRKSETHKLAFPEATYSASAVSNREFNADKLRVSYTSLVTPRSTYDYDMSARRLELLKRQPVGGGYKPEDYVSERIYATADDGTRVPISVVYKKGTKRDGTAPLHLYGYGSYGVPSDASFSVGDMSLLDRGVVLAIAHVRGGGELGRTWYEAGKMNNKRNSFTDFIACAEHLVKEKYAAPGRIGIEGGSAGGLLVGAVMNLRPDLFRAAIVGVPFVDIMNTMLDPTLPLTTGEYLEWGNPNEKAAFDYMLSYSPYDNIKATRYPAMFVHTSLNDSQVPYWEPAKYVAKLRATRSDSAAPIVLKTDLDAGHGGASGRYDAYKEGAERMAFLLWQLGVEKPK